MLDCRKDYTSLVPLSKVVAASIIDTYEDAGKSTQTYSHWAARGLKKLESETIKGGIKKVLIQVNRNTMTATLPLDFKEEVFVGIYDENYGIRKPIYLNENIIGKIETLDIVDKCDSCNQDKSICESLEVVETEEVVDIDGTAAVKKTIKKIYPDGNYYLEEIIPYKNTVTDSIEYVTTKKYIDNFETLTCGCLADTDENKCKLKEHCPNTYACHYSKCDNVCDGAIGSYNILHETGLIQLSYNFKYDYVYLEYLGFIKKVNGEYAVPEVAFETLVEWTKFKSVCNKKSVTLGERDWFFQNYVRERRNMEKILGRVNLSQIIQSVRRLPNFEITYKDDCYPKCANRKANVFIPTKNVCQSVASNCPNPDTSKRLAPFTLAVKEGEGNESPILGSYTYTSPELVGALNVEYIIVDNTTESKKYGDFTFDSTTGTITRVNPFVEENVLIVPYAKFV